MSEQSLTQKNATPALHPVQSGLLQRQCACGNHTVAGGECDECRKKREGMLQRSAASAAPVNKVPPIVHEVLRSPGQPLDPTTRAFMEPRFGHDFSNVRVHTDAKAAESAQAVNALAFTVGHDLIFGKGQYKPDLREGRRLLAHELTHVLQQGNACVVQAELRSEPTSSPLEVEADLVADQVLASQVSESISSVVGTRLQCQARAEGMTQDPRYLDNQELINEYRQILAASDPVKESYFLALEAEIQRRLQIVLHQRATGTSAAQSSATTPQVTEASTNWAALMLAIRLLLGQGPSALPAGGAPLPLAGSASGAAAPAVLESGAVLTTEGAALTTAEAVATTTTAEAGGIAFGEAALSATLAPVAALLLAVWPCSSIATSEQEYGSLSRLSNSPMPAPSSKPQQRRDPGAYPILWPAVFGPPMFFDTPITYFRRTPNAERDQDYAWEVRRELWARHRGSDPDLMPRDWHAHHIVPLFLGGLEGARGNVTFLPGRLHLSGHGQLASQPQMATPPPPLPPLHRNILKHPAGTLYELVGFK